MRRKDREITDAKAIADFIAREQIIRITFCDENDIYIVPVNYGYLCKDGNDSFYFHGAKAGRKYELAKQKPLVGFEIDGNYKLLEDEIACKCSARFQSVTGTGVLQLVDDGEEKQEGLAAIMKQATHKTEWNYSDEMLKTVAVFRLDVDKMSCKAK